MVTLDLKVNSRTQDNTRLFSKQRRNHAIFMAILRVFLSFAAAFDHFYSKLHIK